MTLLKALLGLFAPFRGPTSEVRTRPLDWTGAWFGASVGVATGTQAQDIC